MADDHQEPDHPHFKQASPRSSPPPCPHRSLPPTPWPRSLADASHPRRPPSRRSSSSSQSQTPAVRPLCCPRPPPPHAHPTRRVLSPAVSAAAVQLSAEYLRLFATEAIHRAAEVAQRERAKNGPVDRLAPPGLLEVRPRPPLSRLFKADSNTAHRPGTSRRSSPASSSTLRDLLSPYPLGTSRSRFLLLVDDALLQTDSLSVHSSCCTPSS